MKARHVMIFLVVANLLALVALTINANPAGTVPEHGAVHERTAGDAISGIPYYVGTPSAENFILLYNATEGYWEPRIRRYYGSYMMSQPAATTITTAGTYYKVEGTTTAMGLNDFTHSNNRLTYTGPEDAVFYINMAFSISSDKNNTLVEFRTYKNGTDWCPCSYIKRWLAVGADIGDCSAAAVFDLSTGDYFELWATGDTNGQIITIETLGLWAMRAD